MKELRRKAPEDEMLVVHKPGTRPEPDKSGRDRGVIARTPDLDKGDLELMRRKLSLARNAREKRLLLAEIQRKFGNERASHLIHELTSPTDPEKEKP